MEAEEIKAFLKQHQPFPNDESWEANWIDTFRSALDTLESDLYQQQYPCVWTGEDPSRFQIDPEIARLLFRSIGTSYCFGSIPQILALVSATSPDVVESIAEEGLDSAEPATIGNACELINTTQRPMHRQKVRALFDQRPDLREETMMAMCLFKAPDDIAWLKQLLQDTDDADLQEYCRELLEELD